MRTTMEVHPQTTGQNALTVAAGTAAQVTVEVAFGRVFGTTSRTVPGTVPKVIDSAVVPAPSVTLKSMSF